VKTLVQDFLSEYKHGQWLLVFDNADDMDMWYGSLGSGDKNKRRLVDYLPHNTQGCVLFTTRDKKLATKLAKPNIINLKEMNEETALQLLKKSLATLELVKNNLQDTKSLLKELTYLLLTII
jgi:hypothetical protein